MTTVPFYQRYLVLIDGQVAGLDANGILAYTLSVLPHTEQRELPMVYAAHVFTLEEAAKTIGRSGAPMVSRRSEATDV